jgi:hypothetical protein
MFYFRNGHQFEKEHFAKFVFDQQSIIAAWINFISGAAAGMKASCCFTDTGNNI